jgi:hypothetical protein
MGFEFAQLLVSSNSSSRKRFDPKKYCKSAEPGRPFADAVPETGVSIAHPVKTAKARLMNTDKHR